jgi:hypothetical protein
MNNKIDIQHLDKLQQKFEKDSFKHNFSSLNNVLYYFSFFGNIFSIIFAYFFVKNITNYIPEFFSGQEYFLAVFILIFMIGFELFKRFAFEQFVISILKIKKLTLNIFVSSFAIIVLVLGSFYLSLNGAERIINQSQVIIENVDERIQQETNELRNIYIPRINNFQNQVTVLFEGLSTTRFASRDRADINRYNEEIRILENELQQRIKEVETKYQNIVNNQENLNQDNILALVLITSFMEFVILIGVGFHAFYDKKTYDYYLQTMDSPQYKKLIKFQNILKLLYQNGLKKEGDNVPSFNSLKAMVIIKNINIPDTELRNFVNMCLELEIIKSINKKKRIFNVNYEQSVNMLNEQNI